MACVSMSLLPATFHLAAPSSSCRPSCDSGPLLSCKSGSVGSRYWCTASRGFHDGRLEPAKYAKRNVHGTICNVFVDGQHTLAEVEDSIKYEVCAEQICVLSNVKFCRLSWQEHRGHRLSFESALQFRDDGKEIELRIPLPPGTNGVTASNVAVDIREKSLIVAVQTGDGVKVLLAATCLYGLIKPSETMWCVSFGGEPYVACASRMLRFLAVFVCSSFDPCQQEATHFIKVFPFLNRVRDLQVCGRRRNCFQCEETGR